MGFSLYLIVSVPISSPLENTSEQLAIEGQFGLSVFHQEFIEACPILYRCKDGQLLNSSDSASFLGDTRKTRKQRFAIRALQLILNFSLPRFLKLYLLLSRA